MCECMMSCIYIHRHTWYVYTYISCANVWWAVYTCMQIHDKVYIHVYNWVCMCVVLSFLVLVVSATVRTKTREIGIRHQGISVRNHNKMKDIAGRKQIEESPTHQPYKNKQASRCKRKAQTDFPIGILFPFGGGRGNEKTTTPARWKKTTTPTKYRVWRANRRGRSNNKKQSLIIGSLTYEPHNRILHIWAT